MELWSFCLETNWMLCRERPGKCPRWRGKGWQRCDSVLCCLTCSAATLQLWAGQSGWQKALLGAVFQYGASPPPVSPMWTGTQVPLVQGGMKWWPVCGRQWPLSRLMYFSWGLMPHFSLSEGNMHGWFPIWELPNATSSCLFPHSLDCLPAGTLPPGWRETGFQRCFLPSGPTTKRWGNQSTLD